MDAATRREIRGIALRNASEHGGRTADRIVMGRILGARQDLRGRVPEVSAAVAEEVASVNAMEPDAQLAELGRDHAGAPRPERPAERKGLPELPGAEHGAVVTRFPPEPNGYPHIGHAKAAIINTEYARMYGGTSILRMDDTNPESERMEYHAAINVGLEWLGVRFDRIKSTSDDMETFYEKGDELIRSGRAYVCTCKRDDVSKNRRARRACKCSRQDADKNEKGWHKMMTKYKPGEATVRFRGDMGADNAVMRDPVLFRVMDVRHYATGDRYRVWPSYDMAVAIEDSIDGVTHAFRSKEFELRAELIGAILDALSMRKPRQAFFSRLEFRGMPTSKRIIRPLIDEGRVSWYDDPRLPTLEALRRRGIRPEAVREFVMSLGLTKADTLAPFEALEAFNRRLVDPASPRLFMADSPERLALAGLDVESVELPNHPTEEMGTRRLETDSEVFIPGADAGSLREGARVRLLGLGDVTITGTAGGLAGRFEGTDAAPGVPKVQWVPSGGAHRIRVIVPGPLFGAGGEFDPDSLRELDAYVEPRYAELEDGTEVQFVRFGYCRKDAQTQAIFTHK